MFRGAPPTTQYTHCPEVIEEKHNIALQEQNDKKAQAILEKEQDVSNLTEKCSSLGHENSEKDDEIKRLQSSLKRKDEDIAVFTRRICDQGNESKKITEQVVFYKEQTAKLGKDISEMNNPRQNNDVKDLNRKIVQLEKDNFAFQEEVQDLRKMYDGSTESEHALTCCKNKLEERNSQLKEEIEKFKAQN